MSGVTIEYAFSQQENASSKISKIKDQLDSLKRVVEYFAPIDFFKKKLNIILERIEKIKSEYKDINYKLIKSRIETNYKQLGNYCRAMDDKFIELSEISSEIDVIRILAFYYVEGQENSNKIKLPENFLLDLFSNPINSSSNSTEFFEDKNITYDENYNKNMIDIQTRVIKNIMSFIYEQFECFRQYQLNKIASQIPDNYSSFFEKEKIFIEQKFAQLINEFKEVNDSASNYSIFDQSFYLFCRKNCPRLFSFSSNFVEYTRIIQFFELYCFTSSELLQTDDDVHNLFFEFYNKKFCAKIASRNSEKSKNSIIFPEQVIDTQLFEIIKTKQQRLETDFSTLSVQLTSFNQYISDVISLLTLPDYSGFITGETNRIFSTFCEVQTKFNEDKCFFNQRFITFPSHYNAYIMIWEQTWFFDCFSELYFYISILQNFTFFLVNSSEHQKLVDDVSSVYNDFRKKEIIKTTNSYGLLFARFCEQEKKPKTPFTPFAQSK